MADKIYKVRDPQGNIREIKGPEGATDDEIIVQAQKLFAQPPAESSSTQNADPSILQQISQPFANLGAGAIRGAGSIGATLLRPFETAQENEERRKAMDAGLASMGADPNSIAYGLGKFGTEVAGTAGVGGALAKGLSYVPRVAAAAPNMLSAIGSAGFNSGNAMGIPGLATRVAGGALTGGVSAGLVNPKDAETGAIFGGGLPAANALAKGSVVLGKNVLGVSTGARNLPLEEAYNAGKTGGKTADTFLQNMRKQTEMNDVLIAAKDDLRAMNAARQAEYRSGMIDVANDKTILDFKNIDNAIDKSMDMISYKGQIKNTKAADAVNKIKNEIETWKTLNPAEYHTPEGLDALKQKIGSMIEDIPFEQKGARKAASGIYNSLKDEISAQAPTYSKVMKNYEDASNTIKEIERTLSLNPKASVDTSLRKLQSLMRNNVSTNYGQRVALAKELEQSGSNQITPALAGQVLSEWTPRGFQRAAAMPTSFAAFSMGGLPAAIGAGAMTSPRLVGEAAYLAGKTANALSGKKAQVANQLMYRSVPLLGTD